MQGMMFAERNLVEKTTCWGPLGKLTRVWETVCAWTSRRLPESSSLRGQAWHVAHKNGQEEVGERTMEP